MVKFLLDYTIKLYDVTKNQNTRIFSIHHQNHIIQHSSPGFGYGDDIFIMRI